MEYFLKPHIFRYYMALRTCNQKAINDKMVAKLSGLGIAFHIFLCAGSILLIFSKNIYLLE